MIIVSKTGEVRFIFSDEARLVLSDIGVAKIRRASHVNPTDDGRWTADISPCSGPVLGPFDTRKQALAEETRWLREHDVPVPHA